MSQLRRRIALPLLTLMLGLGLGSSAEAVRRLSRDALPTFEAIELHLDPNSAKYTGWAKVELDVRRPITELAFHAERMRIVVARLEGGSGPALELHPVEVPQERGLLSAPLPAPLAPGAYRLHLEFVNEFGTQAVGLYRTASSGLNLLYTQFEEDDAREAFPCWDEPSFKLPYQITVEAPAEMMVVSNTLPEAESALEDGWRRTVFHRTPPLPSYLLALAVGRFETAPIPGLRVPGRVVFLPGQAPLAAEAVRATPPVLMALEEYFGSAYPYEKLDLIAVPEFWPGAMENPGAITFADQALLIDSAHASVSARGRLVHFLAHELAHMWFGDLVTMAWWDDLWLNESFADWLSYKIVQKIAPQYRYDLETLSGVHSAMHADTRPSVHAIRRPVNDLDSMMQDVGMAYTKGRAILDMFEAWLGEDVFRSGIRAYLAEHVGGNTTALDLWTALGKASGRDVASPMGSFLDQPGIPLVQVEILPDGRLRLRQRRFLGASAGSVAAGAAQTWKIPIQLTLFDGQALRQQSLLLDQAEMIVQPEARPVWVFPNSGARGYYRWSVPAAVFLELARAGVERLNERERLDLVDTSSALLTAGELHGGDLLHLAELFAHDPEPSVVEAALGLLDQAKEAFITPELRPAWSKFVRRTLAPALSKLGLERRPDEPPGATSLRPNLLDWLGTEGQDPGVLDFARGLARRFEADPNSVDDDLVGVALNLEARSGDLALFERDRKAFEQTPNPSHRRLYLSALGQFRDPHIEEAALRYSFEGPLRPQELLTILWNQRETEADRDRVLDWTIQNYAKLAAKAAPVLLERLPALGDGCSEERLAKARTFFLDPARASSVNQTSIDRVTDRVRECINLRTREADSAAEFLKGFQAP